MFRQDTDAYIFHIALRYGCHQRQNSAVVDVEFDDAGATVTSARGEQFRTRYVVDASGFRSPLADKLRLRDEPCRFKHHSRSVWNHMVGMIPTDDLFNHPRQDRPPVPWYQGTVHHMFDRGWFWVIGFDNHKASRSPLCSVGLTLDPRKYPKDPSQSPAEDFFHHAARFPDIARQYAAARPVREWTSTDRLQYSSWQVVGDRWCLLSHAAAFIDPLFSRGLSNTAETINALAWRILAAVKDDDFSAERFEYIERLQQGLFDFNDELVNSAFISFADYELWSAVFRIWAWGSNAGTFRLQEALTKFLQDGRDTHLRDLEEAQHLGFYWPDHDGYRKLFDQMVGQCEAVEAGLTSSSTAADTLHELLVMSDFVPRYFGFSDRSRRYLNPTPAILLKTILWAYRDADPRVRELMLGVGKDALMQKLRGRRIF
jgi:FADH2 O2-dependent halogenase